MVALVATLSGEDSVEPTGPLHRRPSGDHPRSDAVALRQARELAVRRGRTAAGTVRTLGWDFVQDETARTAPPSTPAEHVTNDPGSIVRLEPGTRLEGRSKYEALLPAFQHPQKGFTQATVADKPHSSAFRPSVGTTLQRSDRLQINSQPYGLATQRFAAHAAQRFAALASRNGNEVQHVASGFRAG